MFDSIYYLKNCGAIVEGFRSLLIFSHYISASISFVFGCFVYYRNAKSLLSNLIFFISITFTLWIILDLIIWLNFDNSNLVMFAWMPMDALNIIIYLLTTYFVYVYSFNRDVKVIYKIISIFTMLMIFLLLPTDINLVNYNYTECIAETSDIFINIALIIKLMLAILITIIIIIKIRTDYLNRFKSYLLAIGILFFIYSNLVSEYISDVTKNYIYEIYGIFGMVAFISIISYLAIKFRFFEIKIVSIKFISIILLILSFSILTFSKRSDIYLTAPIAVTITVFCVLLLKGIEKELKAYQDLLELTELKTQFISLARHHVATPLTVVSGHISIIKEYSAPDIAMAPRLQTSIRAIEKSTEKLIQVTRNFLDMSRFDDDGIEPHFQKVNILDLINQSIEILHGRMSRCGISVHTNGLISTTGQTLADNVNVHDDSDTGTIHADPKLFTHAFNNILEASMNIEKERTLEISIIHGSSVNYLTPKICTIEIIDPHHYVFPQIDERIRRKFTREGFDAVTSEHFAHNTGLHVAHKIVAAHHGTFTVTEKDGATIFIVKIPYSDIVPIHRI